MHFLNLDTNALLQGKIRTTHTAFDPSLFGASRATNGFSLTSFSTTRGLGCGTALTHTAGVVGGDSYGASTKISLVGGGHASVLLGSVDVFLRDLLY